MAEDEIAWHSFTVLFRELGEFVDGRSAYEDDIEAELERLGIGEVHGGGTWLDGSGCDISVSVTDPVAGLRAIREVLRALAAPDSKRIISDAGEFPLYDSEAQFASACSPSRSVERTKPPDAMPHDRRHCPHCRASTVERFVPDPLDSRVVGRYR